MELRQLRHFVAIAEEGSITAAARKLRLTQPALSRQIKALEEELDVPLLERGAHSIELTQAGELLAAESLKMLKFAEGMVERVRASARVTTLRIGYAPSLAGEFLATAMARFTQLHPNARVQLFDWSTAEMRQGLVEGKLDLIVAAPCSGLAESIRWTPLKSYGWQVLMAATHPLAANKRLTLRDLDGIRMVLYDRESYPDYWDRVTRFFRDHDLQAKIAGEFDGIESLASAVEADLGLALLVENRVVDRGQRLASRPLDITPEAIEVSAGVPENRETPVAVLAFLEELRRAATGN